MGGGYQGLSWAKDTTSVGLVSGDKFFSYNKNVRTFFMTPNGIVPKQYELEFIVKDKDILNFVRKY